ncbi:HAAS signaling domain-containing protein [Agrococcus sp. Marseille-P2731]|uniref:HAAS signaling domain-containing protein n=1 Tax=Agrococcus sp. Marseille-P2731 TaxID=1841862 RepID=UPI0011605871|nr:hypothetical protein [Agrococcus sp. Marseille-P2731]
MHQPTPLPLEAQRYLEQLDLEAAMLPQPRRAQLVSQIREHLHDAVEDRAEIRAVLARLGTPRELVAEAQPEVNSERPPQSRSPWPLMLAIAVLAIGVLLLLIGGTVFSMSGRGRWLVLALPGFVFAGVGAVLLSRERRRSREDPAARSAARRAVRWLAISGLAVGVLMLALAGVLFAMTGRWRSVLFALPGILLALACAIALLRGAALSKRAALAKERAAL